ncbi:MucB/RseB C-terminal domain-containing protein [Pseudomonadales bacterium]|nr:MucB/RseB C-terminal domain-containing protein [Pseudomonadales bacterium]
MLKNKAVSQYFSNLIASVLFIICCFTPTLNATPDPYALLSKMEESTRVLTYQGTLVYSQGGQMETLQIFHTLKDGAQSERLIHLTGEPREIIRRGDRVICVHPKNGVVELNHAIPAGPFARNYQARLDSVNEPYSVKFSGYTRVAGRDVTVLAVLPKDAYRYGFKLALDKQTGLLLQSLMVDANNKVLERFEYTEIKIGGDITAKQLAPKFDRSRDRLSLIDVQAIKSGSVSDENMDATKASQKEAKQNWQVSWLPAGFAMSAAHFEQKLIDDEQGSLRNSKMYSDGLSAFSVFVAPDVDMSKASSVQSGATLAYSIVKRDDEGTYSITVVGEIPIDAAKNIAASVNRVAPR